MGGSSWLHIELTRPAWLAALAVLPLLVWYWRRSLAGLAPWRRRASLVCRMVLLVGLIAGLCDLRWVRPTDRQMVVLAVDRSASITDSSAQAAQQLVDKLRQSAGPGELVVLPFAAQPAVPRRGQASMAERLQNPAPLTPNPSPARGEGSSETASEPEDRQGTNLAAAIQTARGLIPPDYVGRIVLLSDGNQTEGDALASARAADVPISTVALPEPGEPEVYVDQVRVGRHVREGVPFEVEVAIHSNRDDQGTVELYRGSLAVDRQTVAVVKGQNWVRFVQSVAAQGPVTYTARIRQFRDTLPDNNGASAVVFVAARPRALLVENESLLGRHLAAALETQKVQVESRRPADLPTTAEALDDYELVVLCNVPAAALAQQAMEALRRYVRDAGGGLLVVGGDQAFTPGGYRNTVLEEILPVRSEFETKEPRPSLAMVLILDRSISMEGTPIELAKEATRRAVGLLDSQDLVGVLAFDDTAQWISPIQPCADKAAVRKRIDTIQAGGRTDMYPAMEKAFLALRQAFARTKHIIVLTDGISEPGDFDALARRIAASGITISTVGVGREVARPLLEDIAKIGKGHSYFCEDMNAVPKIFALETAAATKLGIVERPFFPQVKRSDVALADVDFKRVPSLLGYVGTRAKPTSQVVLSSESGDPLLAWWRYGLGVSVAFTSDVESRWAAAWLGWPGFQRFWLHQARRAMRKSPPADCELRIGRRGALVTATLDAADPRGQWINGAEALLTVVDPRKAGRQVVLQQVAPGRYSGTFPASLLGVYYLETTLRYQGRTVYAERGGLALSYPDEFRMRPPDHDLLRLIAEATGGTFHPAAEAVLPGSAQTVPRTLLTWPYWLAFCAVVLVIDVALRRLVWRRSESNQG